jgi:hypothetical protein
VEKRYIKRNVPEKWYEKPKKDKTTPDQGLRIIGNNSQAGSTVDIGELLSATSPATQAGDISVSARQGKPEELSQDDYRVKNSQMTWHLMNEIPSVLANLFKGKV